MESYLPELTAIFILNTKMLARFFSEFFSGARWDACSHPPVSIVQEASANAMRQEKIRLMLDIKFGKEELTLSSSTDDVTV